jgi:segregation and condensation protein B
MATLTPGALEALLFIYGEPIEIKKAAKILDTSVKEITVAAEELRKELSAAGRGLILLEHETSLQLVTKPAFGQLLQVVLKAELNEALSPASLETLSIVAYAGPIARAEIDYIRGVNSSFTIRALLLRGLIEREPDPERANAYRYKPSVELLHHLGVSRVQDLPEFERFRAAASSIKTPPPATPETPASQPAA